jgi:hypothetical protein
MSDPAEQSRYTPPPGPVPPARGRSSAIAAGIVNRVRGFLVGDSATHQNDPAFSGGWFPPGPPVSPVAPKDDVRGRAFDYQYSRNQAYSPRQEQGESGIDFPTLRRLADPAQGGLDILRLLIETRKDQMAAQAMGIRAKGDRNNDGGKKARDIEQLLQRPDGVHTFRQWLRLLLEEHLVIDAPFLYFGPTALRPPLLEIVDGATMKLLIDEDGRTPLPPLPAYQQILKGVPAADYTMQEFGFYPYNLRADRLYGMSRVEQIVGIVNIALNRQLLTLEYFTSGSVPDAFANLPQDVSSPKQIDEFQKAWDAILSGQPDERRKLRFTPFGTVFTFTKEELLKDAFDEWIARICCFCFSIPPQAFVKEMNRATAETAKLAAQEEGLEPLKLFVKDVIDDVLVRYGADDLEAYWHEDEIADPQLKSAVCLSMYGGTTGTAKPIMTLAEAREMMGLPPATSAQLTELQPPEPEPEPMLGNGKPSSNGNAHGDPASKAEQFAAYVRSGVPRNLAKRLVGLEIADMPGGDDPLIDARLVPIDLLKDFSPSPPRQLAAPPASVAPILVQSPSPSPRVRKSIAIEHDAQGRLVTTITEVDVLPEASAPRVRTLRWEKDATGRIAATEATP